jgi:hypothetical protein
LHIPEGSFGANESGATQETVEEQSKRLEKQVALVEAVLAANEPKRGKRGQESQHHATDDDSAKMQTAHGILQGCKGQAYGAV